MLEPGIPLRPYAYGAVRLAIAAPCPPECGGNSSEEKREMGELAEQQRLDGASDRGIPWKKWGPPEALLRAGSTHPTMPNDRG
jgi:hypothetical protein